MKLLLSAFMLIALTACGFTPMYATSGGKDAPQGLDQIDIALIPDADGVYLRNILIDQFYRGGYPSSPRYILSVTTPTESIIDLDVTIDSESTRRQITMATSLSLTDKATGQIVLTRGVKALTSYNVLGSQFTTRISESDAREAALTDLARQIETQVVLYLKK